jgi:hypothetical protein
VLAIPALAIETRRLKTPGTEEDGYQKLNSVVQGTTVRLRSAVSRPDADD